MKTKKNTMVAFPDPKELAQFNEEWKPDTVLWTSPEGYGWKAMKEPGVWRIIVPGMTEEYEWEMDHFDRSYEKGNGNEL
jgi:glucuronate isomerase